MWQEALRRDVSAGEVRQGGIDVGRTAVRPRRENLGAWIVS